MKRRNTYTLYRNRHTRTLVPVVDDGERKEGVEGGKSNQVELNTGEAEEG